MNFIDKLRIKNLNMRQYVLGSYDGDFEGIEEIVAKARLKITYNGGVELFLGTRLKASIIAKLKILRVKRLNIFSKICFTPQKEP